VQTARRTKTSQTAQSPKLLTEAEKRREKHYNVRWLLALFIKVKAGLGKVVEGQGGILR